MSEAKYILAVGGSCSNCIAYKKEELCTELFPTCGLVSHYKLNPAYKPPSQRVRELALRMPYPMGDFYKLADELAEEEAE